MRRLLVPAVVAWLAATSPLLAVEASAPAATPAARAAIDPATPESAVLLPARVLRDNDFKAFFLALPAEDQAKTRKEWADAQAAAKAATPGQPGAPDAVDGMNALLSRLLAPGAAEVLMAEAEPQLAQLNPQELSQGLAMTAGFLPMMLGDKGGKDPAALKRVMALQAILTEASQWVLTAGLNDPAKLKEAITHVVAGAHALGVKDYAELQALPLEDFLGRLTPLVREIKAALHVYGIEADAFLDSITATAEAPAAGAAADQRTLNVSLKAFGKPFSLPLLVERKEGHWVVSPANGAALTQGMAGGADAGPAGPAAPLEITPAAPGEAPAAAQPLAAPVTP